MKTPGIVFVTGGIGSGKSAVCRILEKRGIPVYDSDSRTIALYDGPLLGRLEQALGTDLRTAGGNTNNGTIDRKKLSSIIFSNPEKLKIVESIVHPAVLADFLLWRNGFDGDQVPFVVMESALVLSKPLFSNVADKVIVVDAPEHLRLDRACKRDGADPESIRRRMAAQSIPLDKADIVITNDCSFDELEKRTLAAFNSFFN